MRRWPARALEGLWLMAVVAVPLAFNPGGNNAFELPKTLLLRALVLLMGLAALAQVITEGRSAFRRPAAPLVWPALAFGLVLALATVFSANPRASLWGSYERQQGLLTLAAYLALFLLTAASMQTHVQIERLWRTLVWGSAPVVAYGLVQAAGLDPLDWRTDAASPVLSTIGRANFLGSYLVLAIPLTAGWTLAASRRWPTSLLLAAQLACLALTQARGAWVGLGVAALVFALVWAATTRSGRLAMAALIAAALAVGFVILLNLPEGPLAPLARLPGLERLATLFRTDAGSTAARLTIWRATLPLIAARPWLGYGQETLRTVFAGVFPPQLVYYQGRHVTVDRAHNLGLDLALSAGLAGVAAFAALLAGFGWLAWALMQNGAFAGAETQIAAADRLSPADPKVWTARGGLYAHWGEVEPDRFVQAETAYRQAVALAPNVATTHTSLGLVLAQQGRLEEAQVELEHAVALDATDGIAFGHLADLYRMLGREEDAEWAGKEAQRWSGTTNDQ